MNDKKRSGCLSVFLWIFFLPIMLTIAIFRSKMNGIGKAILLLIIWGFIAIGALSTSNSRPKKLIETAPIITASVKSTNTENPTPKQEKPEDNYTTPVVTASVKSTNTENPTPKQEKIEDNHMPSPATNEAVPSETEQVHNTSIPVTSAPVEMGKSPDSLSYEEAPYLNGRGIVDLAGREPYYIGIVGYAAVYTEAKLEKDPSFSDTPWKVPVHSKDNQNYTETGYIDHKTMIVITNQDLTKRNGKEYQGYLEFQSLNGKESGFINVENFVTTPYWDETIIQASEKGYCIAVFKQVSNYSPVLKDGKRYPVKNNALVLIPPKGTFFVSVNDRINYPITGIVFDEKSSNAQFVFFNKNDVQLFY